MCSINAFILFELIVLSKAINLDINFPIIYEDPQMETSGRPTYFGYSIITYSSENISWIQVAAPRSNNSLFQDVVEPGIVYRCKFEFDKKDSELSTSLNNENIHPLQLSSTIKMTNNMWLGASMVIQHSADFIIICAPRWRNLINIQKQRMYGICFSSRASNENLGEYYPEILYPDDDVSFIYGGSMKIHENYYGEGGFSAYFLKNELGDNVQAILGAPGIHNFQGSGVLFTNNDDFSPFTSNSLIGQGLFSKKLKFNSTRMKQIKYFGYMGYSVAIGNFFSNLSPFYVMSAPRANDLRGMVTLFQHSHDKIYNEIIIGGKIFGGYFGGNMEVGDINNDGFDDLLVAATMLPIATVYIYISNTKNRLSPPDVGLQKLEGRNFGISSRFGSTIVIADINLDKYNDILIGAPHAEENRGVVCIWTGSSSGFKGDGSPSYILRPSGFYPGLKGFGSSIAIPRDLDNNKYPEIVVGSYLSGHAIIFRGRPVATLEVVFKDNIQLKRDTKEIKIKICLEYHNVIGDILIPIKINKLFTIDNTHRRAYFKNEKNDNKKNEMETIDKYEHCAELIITIKEKIDNYFDPIILNVNVTVIDYISKTHPIVIKKDTIIGEDKFDKTYPKIQPVQKMLSIPFATDCGEDNVCQCDLHAYITIRNSENTFIVGSSEVLVLNVTIENSHEPAYLAQVIIRLPDMVYLARVPSECTVKGKSILCNVENPLDGAKSIFIETDMRGVNIIENRTRLTFSVETLTTSNDINEANNKNNFDLELKINASIRIISKSQELYSYVPSQDGALKKDINFQNLFEIQKHGASPVEEVVVTIRIPFVYSHKGKTFEFIEMYEPQGNKSGESFYCEYPGFSYLEYQQENVNSEYNLSLFSSAKMKRDLRFFMNQAELLPRYHEVSFSRTKRSVNNTTMNIDKIRESYPANRTIELTCENENVICRDITCNLGSFKYSQTFARLLLNLVLKTSFIEGPAMDKKDILLLNIGAKAICKELQNNDGKSETQAISVFVGSPPPSEVELWIIILSVVLGLLLLVLIMSGLMKAGFFERKKKKDLLLLREKTQKRRTVLQKSIQENITNKKSSDSLKEEDLVIEE